MLPQIDAADNGLLERVFEKRRQLCELVKLVDKKEFRFSMRKSYIEVWIIDKMKKITKIYQMLYNTVAIEGVEITVEEAFNLLKVCTMDGLREKGFLSYFLGRLTKSIDKTGFGEWRIAKIVGYNKGKEFKCKQIKLDLERHMLSVGNGWTNAVSILMYKYFKMIDLKLISS
jgi:hypothetical protein